MKTIKLTISYDGTRYHGWQKQDNALSIQEVIEGACSTLFNQPIRIKGAGRTDAGVHAWGQCAALTVKTSIPTNKIPLALNRILPDDIVIIDAEEVALDFHPQYRAKKKTYRYQIVNRKFPIPQMRHYASFSYVPLDVDAMNEAAQYFLGTHDFLAFCSSKNTKTNTQRTIYHASVTKNQDIITFEICGDGFLYNMVRIMTGTLIKVGEGKIKPTEIDQIILSKNRENAGLTVPACGLTMYGVEY